LTYVNSAVGSAVIRSGTHELEGETSRPLMNALPSLLVLARDAWEAPLMRLLAEEIVKDDPGQEAVLDRPLDRVLIAVVRVWFARADADAPGWDRAWGDPVVGTALRLVDDDPARQWTVADLAAEAGGLEGGVRAVLHRTRGRAAHGLASNWRLSLTADLLLEPRRDDRLVAYQVGYTTPYALSTAWSHPHRLAAPAT
jgi:AraC-like DNA-binding protein